MAVIHQILPNLEYGDAISNCALLLRRVLRDLGHESAVFAQFIHPRMWWHGRPLRAARRLLGRKDVVWLYHYSTASEITRMMQTAAGPVILISHNVTPPALALQGAGATAALCHRAQEDLRSLTGVARIALGDSEFNRAQLAAADFPATEVLPIVLDHARFDAEPSRAILRRYNDGSTHFLTVGRVVPHKKIEDVIRVFHYYHEWINPKSRLLIVGDARGAESYREQLIGFCRYLGLSDVVFMGKIRQRELIACYRLASVYLCMSEHEGFCVPLLEGMHLGVPIIAYKCEGVGETLGDAGVLVREKRFDEIGEMAHMLIHDAALRSRVIEKQKERLRHFSEDALRGKLSHILTLVGV